MKRIAVFLVDDHKLFRKNFKQTLEDIPNVDVIGEADNGRVFLEKIKEIKADVVFIDVKMPEINGIEATRQAKIISPDTKFIGMTLYGDENYFLSMVESGASAFLLKDTNKEEIKKALQAVISGDKYFPEEYRKILGKH